MGKIRSSTLFAGVPLLAAGLLAASACDYSGDWLFAGKVEGVRGVDHLGDLIPAVVTSAEEVRAAVLFGEIGPTGTAEQGGVTFTFQGTGGHVCVFVDPELVHYNQSVSARRPISRWTYPDNVYDDGDLDLFAGFATYYSGTPAREEDGGKIGDFRVRYQDSLGQEITIALNECRISSRLANSGGHAGRGTPEYCTLLNTQPGVGYVVLMQTWSTPLDDDVLSYGLLLTEGTCRDMISTVRAANEECIITGEARVAGDVAGDPLPGSEAYEDAFCRGQLTEYCQAEAATKDCGVERCFCGDPADTPSGGSL